MKIFAHILSLEGKQGTNAEERGILIYPVWFCVFSWARFRVMLGFKGVNYGDPHKS